MEIYMKESIYRDLGAAETVMYYVTTKLSQIRQSERISISMPEIIFELYGKLDIHRSLKQTLSKALENLIDIGVVTVEEEFDRHMLLNCHNYAINDKDYYITVDTDQAEKLFATLSTNHLLVFNYMVTLFGTMQHSTKLSSKGYKPRQNVISTAASNVLAYLSDISQRSVYKYTKMLEDLGIIYVYRYTHDVNENGNRSVPLYPNVYSKAADYMYVDSYVTKKPQIYFKSLISK